jgi:hypothetical protein
MTITIDLDTGLATPSETPTIKSGSQVPVTVLFERGGVPTSPGTLSLLQLGLATTAAPPVLLAYLDSLSAQNSNTYTGFLNANDPRLTGFMATLSSAQINCEVAWEANGELFVAPNFSVTVQPRLIPTDPSSETGPSFLQQLAGSGTLTLCPGFAQIVADTTAKTLKLQMSADGGTTWQDTPLNYTVS